MTTNATFLYKFIQKPKEIGSVVPSSSFLTKKMLANLPWDNIETLVAIFLLGSVVLLARGLMDDRRDIAFIEK